jgi:hypothetical protein
MEEYSKKWLEGATEDLDAANLLFQNKKYRQAILYLQQTCEKTAKGLLMKIGFLPDYEENEEQKAAREVVGIKSAKPIDYGHTWHKKFLDVLDETVGSTSPIVKLMIKFPNKELSSNIKNFWNDSEFRNRIEKARRVNINPVPSLKETEDVITACNSILDLSIETNKKVIENAKKTKLPDKKSIIKFIEKQLNYKVNGKSMEMIDKIYNKNPEEFLIKRVTFSFTLTVLAILNIYLLPHEKMARYPDSNISVEYNENLSIIQKFNEISALLKRCLDSVV